MRNVSKSIHVRAFIGRPARAIFCAVSFVGALSAAVAHGETARFLVAELEPVHHDSYVLPLSDPADIAYARGLINNKGTDSIVVAAIREGADGINRDYLAPGSPEWSWHISQFIQFASNTTEILDGWPSYVESDVPGWIANTRQADPAVGHIGFWSYSVVAEILSGDYDGDLDVDDDDYSTWTAAYGSITDLAADGNGDGVVDTADYIEWRIHVGQSITLPPDLYPPAGTVPEPATLASAMLAAIAAPMVRRWG